MHADRRLVVTLACLLLPSLAVMAQSNVATTDGEPLSDSFRPRQVITDQDVSEVSTDLLASKLARLRQQASEFPAPRDNIVGLTRLVHRIAESGELPRDQLPRESKQPRDAALGRLALPARELMASECHAAAFLHSELFSLVDDTDFRKSIVGSQAIVYLEQYIELARVRQAVWKSLQTGGILVEGNQNVPFTRIDHGESELAIFEYHGGFYCVPLWFSGGHRYTSMLATADGDLAYASLDIAARLVTQSLGQPETTEQAVRFLSEVLRVLPYENTILYSAADIPLDAMEDTEEREEILARNRAALKTYLEGKAVSISPPTRVPWLGKLEYVIYVHRRLGGRVMRYRLLCGGAGPVMIQEQTIAYGIGDCWGIM